MPGEIRGGDTTLLDWPAALHGMPPDASDDESLPSMVPSSSSAVSTTSGAGDDLYKQCVTLQEYQELEICSRAALLELNIKSPSAIQ